MKKAVIYPAIVTESVTHATKFLQEAGLCIVDAPFRDVTHYLFPVPSPPDLSVPHGITAIGGNLPEAVFPHALDLLQDADYLAENAAITAHCAITLAAQQLRVTFRSLPVLVIGWGRIGKCLASQLKSAGASVRVAARRESDRAMLRALGFAAVSLAELPEAAENVRVLFNTVPASLPRLGGSALKIDLASAKGLEGGDILHARGLPGKIAPEAAGKLMAQTILRLLEGDEDT